MQDMSELRKANRPIVPQVAKASEFEQALLRPEYYLK